LQKDAPVQQLGGKIVRLTINRTMTDLHYGPPVTNPQRLVSIYADLAINFAHLPDEEQAAMVHRLAAWLLAYGFGSSGQVEWQRLLLAADVYRAGRGAIPVDREAFIAALISVSGDRYCDVFQMPGFEGMANSLFDDLIASIEAPDLRKRLSYVSGDLGFFCADCAA
jgi:hypothetical protein